MMRQRIYYVSIWVLIIITILVLFLPYILFITISNTLGSDACRDSLSLSLSLSSLCSLFRLDLMMIT